MGERHKSHRRDIQSRGPRCCITCARQPLTTAHPNAVRRAKGEKYSGIIYLDRNAREREIASFQPDRGKKRSTTLLSNNISKPHPHPRPAMATEITPHMEKREQILLSCIWIRALLTFPQVAAPRPAWRFLDFFPSQTPCPGLAWLGLVVWPTYGYTA